MSAKVSICIPTYNRSELLSKTLASITPQARDNNNFEIIISDNCSTDSTEDVVREYRKQCANIRYYKNKQNLGFDGNVVACLDHVKTDYLFYLSDDDIALPGTLAHLYKQIVVNKPAVVCLAHYGFEGEDHTIKNRVFFPETDCHFDDGKKFFAYSGLGFLSSLVLKTDYAQEFREKARIGLGCAHLDIASRIALSKPGPYIFIGTYPIAGRAPSVPEAGSDLMRYGYIYVNRLYHQLVEEKLLDGDAVLKREKSLIRYEIPRYILNQLSLGDSERVYRQKDMITKEFGCHWQFYVYILPLFYVPKILIKYPYITMRHLVKKLRTYRYN